jgi:hypothetical protein
MRLVGHLRFQRDWCELSRQVSPCLLIESSAATGEWLHFEALFPSMGSKFCEV